ncbi:hypothetical protein [Pseudarthrobacter sulfonivorans]|uniref:hypothetical protein n=1 Tax=Pseudarthrobacter sulfonivorans TaxID=121292 RepID=UPI00277F5BEC|nr:hypothetical protein [Pseudarthrobacter sulfonivorans]MDP9996803.1 hypothetical protein [Pseudarthrobacter sulfonivorans]
MMHPAQVPSGHRLARRRRLLWWSLLPVLLILCLAAKLLSVGVLAGNAARAFEAGDPRAVAEAVAGLRIANFTEPHKAPFAEGDGLFLAGDFAGARQRFGEALEVAGHDDECVIRVNLVLSIERLGDARAAAGDPTAAARLFAEGLAVVEAAPAACFDAAAEAGGVAEGAEAEAGEKLEQAAERLTQKSAEAAAGTAPDPGSSPGQEDTPAEPGHQSRLEELNKSTRDAQSERNSGRERDEYLSDDDFGAGPDKPW